jgi:SAM-dependent methyltransferase
MHCLNQGSKSSATDRKLDEALRRFNQGKLGDARRISERILAGNPNNVGALKILGAVLTHSRKINEAIPVAQRVCQLSPGDANAYSNLSYLYGLTGNFQQALLTMAYAVNSDPRNTVHQDKFSRLINQMEFYQLTSETAVIQQAMIVCLGNPRTDPDPFSTAWHSLLLLDPVYQNLSESLAAGDYKEQAAALSVEAIRKPLADPFLLLGLSSLITVNERLERVLTFLRRMFLSRAGEYEPKPYLPFLCALAEHCMQNEHVFGCTPEEQATVEALEAELGDGDDLDADTQARIALVLCYQPSAPLDLKAVAGRPADEAFRQLLETAEAFALTENGPGEEESSIPAAEASTPNSVSAAVARQYEENPYPRWRRLHIPALSDQQRARSRGKNILVAGCGTGYEPLNLASIYPEARVVGVDLSGPSLAYARRKAEEFGIGNVEFLQGDILEIDRIGEQFDLVSSVGVLHHMEDPLEGWQKLVDCLAPDGLMKIALYSETARKAVVECREWIEKEGFEATPDGIRAFRQAIMALEDGDPLRGIMNWTDFYTLSMCRDLVFHVQEQRVTLPWIRSALDRLGLCCLTMRISNPMFRNEYRSVYPDDKQINDLDKLHQYEQRNPDTFRDMYEFRCCRPGTETAKRPPPWL